MRVLIIGLLLVACSAPNEPTTPNDVDEGIKIQYQLTGRQPNLMELQVLIAGYAEDFSIEGHLYYPAMINQPVEHLRYDDVSLREPHIVSHEEVPEFCLLNLSVYFDQEKYRSGEMGTLYLTLDGIDYSFEIFPETNQ